MADSSRTGFPARNPEYPEGATPQSGRGIENPLPGMPSGENLLPARTTGGRLNRSAERLGRSVGSVVCGLSSVPNRFGAARSRLNVPLIGANQPELGSRK